jgi:hypothetical protein
MNFKLWLNFAVSAVDNVSLILASKDDNDTGNDDRAARFLRYVGVGLRAIINDQPIPNAPAEFRA